MKLLIVGLGNIGMKYKKTRHNIGFRVVSALAKKENWKFQKKKKLKGYIANGEIEKDDIYLLKPTTYMNESGFAVKAFMDYLMVKDILVIVDDVYIPFGEFRLKKQNSSGGHKGLLSIEKHLKTKNYLRLRIGVGKGEYSRIKNYVLGKFSKEEEKQIPKIVDEALEVIYLYLKKGLDIAMNKANVRKKIGVKDEKEKTAPL